MSRNILLFIVLISTVSAWDDDDFEVFDVVEEVNQNFYELLGVAQDASPSEIKSAFKRLTLKLHPDKNDAPDADVQFRNLVSVHNILKDPGKREKYNDVLKNGLPNWRSAVYYYRHVRKMGLAEGSLILFIIISFGQYAVAWAAYMEKKFTAEQILNTRGKRHLKKGFESGLAEVMERLPKPSIKNTLPFQIPKFIIWSILAIPRAISEWKQRMKEKEEEEKRQKKREEEERKRAEREAAVAEARKADGARRRRGFVPPPREDSCLLDPVDEPTKTGPVAVPVKSSPPVITGGLWTDDDLAELVRLVKKFPSGTEDRWEKIAEGLGRGVAEVTHMANKMKDAGYKPPQQQVEEIPPEPPKKVKTRKAEEVSAGNWSQQQQKALEAALAKHPKGGAGDRWHKIASAVPGKTKEECMQRCKYLSELVKKQKQKEEEQNQANSEETSANSEETSLNSEETNLNRDENSSERTDL